MPRANVRIPKLRHHKHTNRAVVTIEGREIYLGTWNTPEAEQAYKRVIAEWLDTGRVRASPRRGRDPGSPAIDDLVLAYWRYAERRCRRETLHGTIRPALRRLRSLYGDVSVADFDPPALRAFQQALLREPGRKAGTMARTHANKLVNVVRRVFKWGVSEGLVPVQTYQALCTVEGVRMGTPGAAEPEPVRPVPEQDLEATIAELSPVVADMVRVQRLTGMRPGELTAMRPADLEMSGEIWHYQPSQHKNAHRGHTRRIPVGPRAQAILRPYLGRPIDAPLFSPREAEAARGRRPGRAGRWYTTVNYGQAIRRACERAGVAVWSPNRLRHTRATELRERYGVDGAGAVLGHAKVETTQIYAERNGLQAERIAAEVG